MQPPTRWAVGPTHLLLLLWPSSPAASIPLPQVTEGATEYLAEALPGARPVLFSPGIVSSEEEMYGTVVFSPDQTEAYWAKDEQPGLFRSDLVDGRWTQGEEVPLLPRDRRRRVPALLSTFIPRGVSPQEGPAAELLRAVAEEDRETIEEILDADPSLLRWRDGDGMTPLHHAAFYGSLRAAATLLGRGADLEARDLMDRTPLHHAANEGNADLVELFLDRGGELEVRESRGRTPLFLAANWGNDLEAVRGLIAAGANVNDHTPLGEEILFSTLFYGLPEIIDALLDAGASLPEDEGHLLRSLFLAASNGNDRVFALARDEAEERDLPWSGRVSMHAAARGGSVAIGEALLEQGVEIDERELHGVTPLHIAAENGRKAFVEFLVGEGASMERTSFQGTRAIHLARENGHDSVAAALLALGDTDDSASFPPLTGPWLGQPQPAPGDPPLRFALGIVSGHSFNSEHSPPVFSPDGKEVFWAMAFPGPIAFSRLEEGGWTRPETAPFLSEHGEGEPFFSPNGHRLYFLSRRPLEPGGEAGKENIWFVERKGEAWSDPRAVGDAVNRSSLHWCFSVAASGTLYFHSVREDGLGRQDIYRSVQVDGVHQEPENLGPIINSQGSERTPFIAPDESYLVYSSNGLSGEDQSLKFYISYRSEEGTWSAPQVLDRAVEGVANPLCPVVAPGGEFFFFIGDGDVWWTRADFVKDRKPPT